MNNQIISTTLNLKYLGCAMFSNIMPIAPIETAIVFQLDTYYSVK